MPPPVVRGVDLTTLSHRSHLLCFLHVHHTNLPSLVFLLFMYPLPFHLFRLHNSSNFILSTAPYLLLGKASATTNSLRIIPYDLHLALLVYPQWWPPPVVDPPFLRLPPLIILFWLHLYSIKLSLPGLPFSLSLALARARRTRMRRRCFLLLPELARVFFPLCLA